MPAVSPAPALLPLSSPVDGAIIAGYFLPLVFGIYPSMAFSFLLSLVSSSSPSSSSSCPSSSCPGPSSDAASIADGARMIVYRQSNLTSNKGTPCSTCPRPHPSPCQTLSPLLRATVRHENHRAGLAPRLAAATVLGQSAGTWSTWPGPFPSSMAQDPQGPWLGGLTHTTLLVTTPLSPHISPTGHHPLSAATARYGLPASVLSGLP